MRLKDCFLVIKKVDVTVESTIQGTIFNKFRINRRLFENVKLEDAMYKHTVDIVGLLPDHGKKTNTARVK